MRESFLIYKSFYEPIKLLDDKQLGKLFRAIFEYQINEQECKDIEIKMAFEFFKNQFRLDDTKYQKVVDRNKNNGKLGGRPKKDSETQENPKNPMGLKKPKKADNDNEKENEKEKDNEKVNVNNNIQLAEKTILYLNKIANKKYSFTKGNLKEINAQVNKLTKLGDTLLDIEKKFAYVIDVKTKEWLTNPDMNKNLNPVTLFREANFDRYLNQNKVLSRDDMIDAVFDELERRNGK